MPIRVYAAIDQVSEIVERTIQSEEEKDRITARIANLDPNALAVITALFLSAPKELVDLEPQVSEHVTVSLPRLVRLLEQYRQGIEPYLPEDLSTLTEESQLLDPDVEARSIITAFHVIRSSEPDVVEAFLTKLEELTDQTLTIALDAATTPQVLLYQKLYILIVCTYADIIAKRRLLFIFGHSFIRLATIIDINLPQIVRAHLAGYRMVANRREHAIDLATALLLNETELGFNKEQDEMTVKEWVEKVSQGLSANKQMTEFTEWYVKDEDVASNDEYFQSLILKIAVVYAGLIAGEFLVDAGVVDLLLQETPEAEKEHAKTSFELTFASHTSDFTEWIKTTQGLQELVGWLSGIGDMGERKQALITLLRMVPKATSDMQVATAIIELGTFLERNKYLTDADLLVYNQEQKVFEWNQ